MYWNINQILPYQRNFNFINGERSIGKTYTTLKFVISRAIDRGHEFIYLVRTCDEKKNGAFKKAISKVTANEFPQCCFNCNNDTLRLEVDEVKTPLGYCYALSEAVKMKKESFPNVKYMIFDEYMLEESHTISYVNGWKEPDLLLNIYHTVDREQDRVVVFLLGNNTTFYNPYHMHPAFNIPAVPQGEIWTSKYVLFQSAVADDELEQERDKCKFLKMIEQTEYGNYAKDGVYQDSNISFIEELPTKREYYFTITYDGLEYGVWFSARKDMTYIASKHIPNYRFNYALKERDHNENTTLINGANCTHLKWLARRFKNGLVRFDSPETRIKANLFLRYIL